MERRAFAFQPDRIDIVRAKRHLLGQLGHGQPCACSTLIASVAALLGAGPLGHPQMDLPSRDSAPGSACDCTGLR